MHDTAFHIGSLAMNIYADLRTDSILEVGSQAINGSLREIALPTTRYFGIDIEEGEGVDLVIEQGEPLPVENDSFDLVIASSVFEHDPCFWMTFLEMCRATRDGGFIYINAPSNGVVHRYPQDNWRFYPDSGRALAEEARRALAQREEELSATVERSRIMEARLNERFNEIATLTTLLADRQAAEAKIREDRDWLRQAGAVLLNGSDTLKGRLLGLLPATINHKRQQRSLKRKGLFDGDAYLAVNPDVAADRADPLRHYLYHGIVENRRRG
jgi:SAM-dependent methyltransferase